MSLGDFGDFFHSVGNGEVLGATGFALATGDALGGLVGGLAPMPLQAVEHVFGVIALEHAMVVGVHHCRDVDALGARQAVAAARAETVEGLADAIPDGLDMFGVIRLEVFHGRTRLVHVVGGRKADKGGGYFRLGYVESQRGGDDGFVGLAFDEVESLGELRNEPAAERIHCGHAQPKPACGADGVLAEWEVYRAIAERYALEAALFEYGAELFARQVRRDHDVLDEAFFLCLQQGLDGAAVLSLLPLLGLDQAPYVEEGDSLEPQSLQRTFEAGPQCIAVRAHALAGGVESARLHLGEGCAHDFFALVGAVTGGGVEVIHALAVCVHDHLGRTVDVLRVGETHPAETYRGNFLTCLAVWFVPHCRRASRIQ